MGMLDCADLCCQVTNRFSIFICFSNSVRIKTKPLIFQTDIMFNVQVKLFTSPLSSFDLQQLAAMSSHHISIHQRPNGADVPQSFIKGKQLGGKVEGSKTSTRVSQSALLFTGQRRDCTTQQCIRLHGGTEEWVGILIKIENKSNTSTINDAITSLSS